LQRALSTIVLLGLLVASAAAFAITEHLKLIKSPIYGPVVTKVFSPLCHCATGTATITFKLRHPDSVTVTIVDSNSNVVDTLATNKKEPKGAKVSFRWNGRTSAGAVVPNGAVYHPQVRLSHARWTILMPSKIKIDTAPPKVVSARAGAGFLVAGEHHGMPIRYVFAEPAHAALYLHGRRIAFGRRRLLSGKLKWGGEAGGRTLPAGRYALELAAVDDSGNVTPPAGRKRLVVQIRNIAFGRTPRPLAPGASFTVVVRTGAPKYRWRFAGKRGTGKGRLLHLHAPARRGRYRLVVSEHGHSAAATVIVRPKK
jgi:hypothetical protein